MDSQSNQSAKSSAKNLICILTVIFIIFAISLLALKSIVPASKNKVSSNNPNISPAISAPEISPKTAEEKTINDKAVFGDMTAFAKQENGRNYMILSQNGVETILSQADDYREGMEDVGTVGVFSDPEFSPFGNYLTYSAIGWESFVTLIYDLKNKTAVPEMFFSALHGFSQDEKYFFDCEANAMSGEFYGRIYSVPGFKVKYELSFAEGEQAGMADLNCEYDKEKQIVRFTVFGTDPDIEKNRIVEYSLIDNKVRN